MILKYKDKKPDVKDALFIAENSVVIGDVKLGKNSSIWFGAVLRGDINSIKIGEYTNIQDNAVIHVDYPPHNVEIGDWVTVGHGAILHGCKIGDYVLVGMGAVVLNGAKVGNGAIIAAGSVVKENTEIPPFALVAGVPAVVKKIFDESLIEKLKKAAEVYYKLALEYKNALK